MQHRRAHTTNETTRGQQPCPTSDTMPDFSSIHKFSLLVSKQPPPCGMSTVRNISSWMSSPPPFGPCSNMHSCHTYRMNRKCSFASPSSCCRSVPSIRNYILNTRRPLEQQLAQLRYLRRQNPHQQHHHDLETPSQRSPEQDVLQHELRMGQR